MRNEMRRQVDAAKLRGDCKVKIYFTSRAPVFMVLVLLLPFIYSAAACGKDVMRDTSTSPKPAAPQPSPAANAQHTPVHNDSQNVPVYAYEIINSWPHDTKAFTQGLFFHKGSLYESTGHYGSSTLRKIELSTGKVTKKVDVSSQYFAEGITVFHDKIYQLTWTTNKGFIYDLKSFKIEGEFPYEGEGWGLTSDGASLIISNGTNQIRFLDPVTFKLVRTISVLDNGTPLMELNELEYIKGEIYANIWKQERIVRIDPQTGKILGWIDLAGLLPMSERDRPDEDVLNGIAYDEKEDRLFVTGKRWPKLFEIRLKKK
jgi:glutamine cyclotransferase